MVTIQWFCLSDDAAYIETANRLLCMLILAKVLPLLFVQDSVCLFVLWPLPRLLGGKNYPGFDCLVFLTCGSALRGTPVIVK